MVNGSLTNPNSFSRFFKMAQKLKQIYSKINSANPSK